MEEEGVPHFRGLTSLTQTYNQQQIMANIPRNLLPLFHNAETLRLQTNLRDEAEAYQEKCVFYLERHQTEIDFFFHYILENVQRSSV